jgi:hypothetical protein
MLSDFAFEGIPDLEDLVVRMAGFKIKKNLLSQLVQPKTLLNNQFLPHIYVEP